MGLDVYVGSLTRYYTQDWETIAQRWARETGTPIQVLRGGGEETRDPAQVRAAVLRWRSGLSAALQPHGVPPLDWDEAADTAYFTDKPAWDCYAALLLWAAHQEHPEIPLPASAPADWPSHPLIVAAQAGGTRYPNLLLNTELWLPVELDVTFVVEDVTGNRVGVGSVNRLHAELRALNRRTWGGSEADVAGWRRFAAEPGAPLEVSARFGYAIFHVLSEQALRSGFPMKLDY